MDKGASSPAASERGTAKNGDARPNLLVWIDLEMTGLDVERDAIVEIACVVTDTDLHELDEGIDIVVHHDDAVLARMDDFVRNMHTKSGLLTEIAASTVDLAGAGTAVLDYVRAHVPEAGRAPLCGNSIGVDRRFLVRYLPEIDGYLHYRVIDVSTLKELARRWYPDEFRRRPDKSDHHRALDDIRESIAELRYYRETILKPSGPAAGPPSEPAEPAAGPG